MSTVLAKRASVRAEEARVLDVREQRNKLRQELARHISGRSLIELSLDVPRGAASNEDAEHLFLAGVQRLEEALGVAPSEMGEDATGYYGLFVTDLPALLARKRASRIEGQVSWDHHLGIECYGIAGSLGTTGKVPREAVGSAATR
jgi:rhodanese-related sulfurtransferase